jgi:alpha-L-fucosidase
MIFLLGSILAICKAVDPDSTILLPSGAQLRWHDYERTMFVHFGPATWQGREYDDHSIPLSRINPTQLNTDQWCETAQLWGAKMILFVAKHTGGFCWWQTKTSDYSIKNTPWRNGKGDVLKDLSASCRKYGLDLGIYVYSGDDQWGAGMGSGGKTKDTTLQLAYNKVYRQQMTEVLSNYGPIKEVWFDGGCVIPVTDILEKYSSDAVHFGGPLQSLRWVGNEDGYTPYPNWYTLTNRKGTEVYMPVETNTVLLGNKSHKWFWAKGTDNMISPLEQLMKIYYQSVGRGSVLLLNSSPDTTGLIPLLHVEAYREFGNEIKRRFDKPISRTSGQGNELEISFPEPISINHVVLEENVSRGQRVVEYSIEGMDAKGNWSTICTGSSIGSKKIDKFNTLILKKVRVVFTKSKATPVIENFAVYNIEGISRHGTEKDEEGVTDIGYWNEYTYNKEWKSVTVDLTKYVTKVGQYEIKFSKLRNPEESGLEFTDWEVDMYGGGYSQKFIEFIKEGSIFRINRSQQSLDEFPTIFRVKVMTKSRLSPGIVTLKRLTY